MAADETEVGEIDNEVFHSLIFNRKLKDVERFELISDWESYPSLWMTSRASLSSNSVNNKRIATAFLLLMVAILRKQSQLATFFLHASCEEKVWCNMGVRNASNFLLTS